MAHIPQSQDDHQITMEDSEQNFQNVAEDIQMVCPTRRLKAFSLSRSIACHLKKKKRWAHQESPRVPKIDAPRSLATCVLSNFGPGFDLAAGCVQGVSLPRPLGGQERHGDARPLPEAAFNQENICLLPRTHCQILVQHGESAQRAHMHKQPVFCNRPLWWFIRLPVLHFETRSSFVVVSGVGIVSSCRWPRQKIFSRDPVSDHFPAIKVVHKF